MHERGLAVHQPPGAHDLAAEHFDERLMAEAHAEDGNVAGKRFDHAHGHAGVMRRAGAG
jgi:hypothetical protein